MSGYFGLVQGSEEMRAIVFYFLQRHERVTFDSSRY